MHLGASVDAAGAPWVHAFGRVWGRPKQVENDRFGTRGDVTDARKAKGGEGANPAGNCWV